MSNNTPPPEGGNHPGAPKLPEEPLQPRQPAPAEPEAGGNSNQMFESFDAKDDGATEGKSVQDKVQETTAKVQETQVKAQIASNVVQQVVTVFGNPYTWIVILVLAVIGAAALQGISGYQVIGRNPNVCKTAEECQLPKCEASSGTFGDLFDGAVGGVTVKGVPISSEQQGNVAKIVAAGRDNGIPDYGIIIAIATSIQESVLKNINYGDRDSLGLFQQRPGTGWGTPEQITDPYKSAEAFFGVADHTNNPGLVDIQGWQSMSLTAAAQAVQRSGHPDAYAPWENEAKAIFAKMGGSAGTASSGDCAGMAVGGASADATGIVKVATEIAWPDGRKVGGGSSGGKAQSTPAYISYKKKAEQLGGADGYLGGNLFSSCDRFVATVMRNTVDPGYPWGPTATQASYLASNPGKWAPRTGALQPGDVLIAGGSGGSGHTLIYLGNGRVAQASYFSYTATASNENWAPSASGNYSTPWDSRPYKAYYPVAGGGAGVANTA